jgi:hypothetical protein
MKGFSADNLWRMRKMFTAYSSDEFLAQLVPEIKKHYPGSAKEDQNLEQAVPEL